MELQYLPSSETVLQTGLTLCLVLIYRVSSISYLTTPEIEAITCCCIYL